jgi:hypothetical protein
MAINKKRIYELTDEQTVLTDADLGVLDKTGYNKAKKFSMLNLYNYVVGKMSLVTSFLGLSDTPATYTGQSGKVVSVKGTEDGLEFTTISVTSQNIATNDLVFTANSTTDLAGYKATLDNAELKIVADANLNADIPFEITQADGTTKIFDIRGSGDVNIPAENMTINANDRSIFQPTMTMRGTGASKLNLANNTNNGLSLFGNSGQGQILHASGFIQYTVRDGLTADGNMELDGLTFAYDNATNDFKIKFKKADGTVVTKTIS